MKEVEVKIGVDISMASKPARGITTYTENILRGLVGADVPGLKLVLISYLEAENNTLTNLSGNVECRKIPYPDQSSPLKRIFYEQIVNPLCQVLWDLDVVWHPHNRFQFLTPVGYVGSLHDVLPLARPDLAGYLTGWQKRLLYLTRTVSARNADAIITASRFAAKEIVKYLGVKREKIRVIYSGIDFDIFKPERNEENWERIRTKYSLPDRYLLTTGSYAPHKNQKILVDAYRGSILPQKGIGFVMVGPNDAGGYRRGYQEINDYVQKLGLSHNIILLPAVPIEDLVTIYNHAEFFATASLYEGFGFTPLEAMACGIPVVVSNAGALPEVCGEAALYADPNDPASYIFHFNELVGNNNLKQGLVERGKNWVKRFDWRITAKETLEVFLSIANKRKKIKK